MFGLGASKIMGIALVAVVAASALIIWGLKAQLTIAQNELGTATVRVAALEGANKQCETSVKTQNKLVGHWVDVMGTAAKASEVAARNSWGAVRRAQNVSEELLVQKPTGNLEEDCKRLDRNLDEAIKRRIGDVKKPAK